MNVFGRAVGQTLVRWHADDIVNVCALAPQSSAIEASRAPGLGITFDSKKMRRRDEAFCEYGVYDQYEHPVRHGAYRPPPPTQPAWQSDESCRKLIRTPRAGRHFLSRLGLRYQIARSSMRG